MISLAESLPKGEYQQLLQKKEPASIDMRNVKNLGYEGEFWFGNPSQKMSVIFDTGSALAWLFSEKCAEPKCPAKNKKYEWTKSKNFKQNEKGGQMLKYGKGAIAGHPAQDRACFGPNKGDCLTSLNFLNVVNSKDLASLEGSGLIGLSP